MKKLIAIIVAVLSTYCLQAQNSVGIGTASPHSSALLDLNSTNKGFLIPRMTTAQRIAVASPTNGLLVYDTDTNSLWYYKTNTWTNLSGSEGLTLPYLATVNTNVSSFKIINQGSAAALEGSSTADYGIGVRGASTGVGAWGVNASVNRNSATAIYAFSDSGTVINASNRATNNTNHVLDVTNNGMGRTANFQLANTTNTSPSMQIASNGRGNALLLYLTNPANNSTAIELNNAGIGAGLNIKMSHASNGARGIDVQQSGVGPGVFATSAGGTAIWGVTSSISAAGVIGDNTFGEAVVGRNRGGNGVGAVVGRNDSSGYGVRGFNTKNGIGVLGQTGISGGEGNAAIFENVNGSNPQPVAIIRGNGTGPVLRVSNNHATNGLNLAVFIKGNANVARINDAGRGFFNGGTQLSGADVAEMFDVGGERNTYEPGDVLAISTEKDRTVEKSSSAYSSLVVGVYATKPGVILTESDIDAENTDQVPMGVVGVIPTKVCLEGGVIKRGDMLVTSSTAGVAMKADLSKVQLGQVIGKALENFDATTIGKIKALINVK
jgi:hypothetical protein